VSGHGEAAPALDAAPDAERTGERLGTEFFARSVHEVAADLVGCPLLFDGVGGVIVETESYDASDPACHAYGGPTPRSEVLFGPPGRAYVYFSYGIHNLLNAVAEHEGSAAAVLIRALEPLWGIERMREQRGREQVHELCSGPGKLTEALGIGLGENRARLDRPPFELRARSGRFSELAVLTGARIGITRAADYPWRFCAAGSRFLSRPLRAVEGQRPG
jgi:DNA-3-methyladenine glycosylase